ncbi:MAG: hypothetical protein H6835_12815 [Planctomycetes bacterium]|nr:hypothetical protein [Planctomycetota bacterium]
MASTSAPAAADVRPWRPLRLRRRGLLVLVVGLALWLAGRGVGWFGRAEPEPGADAKASVASGAASQADQSQPSGEAPAATDPSPVSAVERHAAPAAPAAPAGESQEATPTAELAAASVPPPAATAETRAIAAPPPPGAAAEEAPPLPFVDADRFHSLCSIVELHLGHGALDEAAASLANLLAMHLDDTQRAAIDGYRRRLGEAVVEVGGALHQRLQSGEVLAARELAERWFAAQGDATELPPPLRDALAADLDWRRPLVRNADVAPQATALARRRRVRLDWHGELVSGSVAQARAEQVTVRVETARGQSYPTVPAVAIEPVDADADEAVEMALVAHAAGEPLLARLWWACAVLRGVDVAAPRAARLRSLLR